MTAEKRWTGTAWEYVKQQPLAHTHSLADVDTLTALPPRGVRRAFGPLRGDPGFGRTQWPGTGGLTDGVITWGNYRAAFPIITGRKSSAVRLVYVNAYLHEDVPVPNNITVRAAVEDQNNVIYPVFFRGQRSVVIEPGGVVISDPVALETTVGLWARTNVSVNSGEKWPLMEASGGGTSLWVAEGGDTGTGANTDHSTSGSITGTGVFMYRPIMVLASMDTIPSKAVCGIGDSIATGTGDNTGPFPDGGKAFIRRAINNTLPLVMISMGGEMASTFVTDVHRQIRSTLIDGATSVICNLGRNDLANSQSSATISANLLAIATHCANKGAAFYQTTITPDTTSTDSWATAANQTPQAWTSVRVDLNTWLRGGAPIDQSTKTRVAVGTVGALVTGQAGHPISGVFDVAAQVECDASGTVTLNGGRWRVDLGVPTTDGVHPTTVLHQRMASIIDPTTLA